MIPEPVSAVSLVAILAAAAGLLLLAAYKAAAGSTPDKPAAARRSGFTLAAVASVLALSASIFAVNVLMTHGQNYDAAVFATLAQNYGVHAAAAGEGFTPGVPFAAVLEGQTVECTVTLPDAVLCAGELVPLSEGGGN